MGFRVGAWEDDGVDVLGHEGAHEVDLGVGGGGGREGEKSWEGRHLEGGFEVVVCFGRKERIVSGWMVL